MGIHKMEYIFSYGLHLVILDAKEHFFICRLDQIKMNDIDIP